MNIRILFPAALLIACYAIPAGETPLHPHPRLGLNAELLAHIARLRQQKSPLWSRYQEWIDAAKAGRPPYVATGGVETSALFGYATSRDPALFEIGLNLLAPKIWRASSHPERGVRSFFGKCPEAVYCDDHEAASNGGALIATVALLYDWGYDRLSPSQRKDLISWLNGACEWSATKSPWVHAHFRNDGAYTTLGFAAAAYATEGENPQAAQLKTWFRESWRQTLRALDIMGQGGAMAEGNAYGEVTGAALINIANYVYYASGEDLFQSHAWFRKRLAYEAFTIYPNSPQSPPADLEGVALGGDDDRGGNTWHTIHMRPDGLPLARRFAGTEEANLWNWVFRQPAIDHGADAWYELFYYDVPRPLKKPLALSYFDPSMGYVYVRSDWNSRDATWISFWAGPHLDIHQHLDQGAFTVFKRRDLAIKSGDYDFNPLSPHDINYYTRTVSANTLLIGNPEEYFAGFVAFYGCGPGPEHTLFAVPNGSGQACPANDGGERTAFPKSLSLFSVDEFAANRANYDVARVTAFRDTGDVVSWAADITNAYANPRFTAPGTKPKVSRVWRRFVYLRRSDVLVVADQVISTDEKFRKSWLLHAVDHVDVAGQASGIAPGESTHSGTREATIVVDDDRIRQEPAGQGALSPDLRLGYAALHVQTLFPRDFRYRLTGGREASATPHRNPAGTESMTGHLHRHLRDFWVEDYSAGRVPDHVSANWPPTYPQEAQRADTAPAFWGGYGRWRLAVEPVSNQRSDLFLNVLTPSLKRGTASATSEAFEDGASFGAVITVRGRKTRVVFARERLDLPSVE